MKLELKHLTPYLPYELWIETSHGYRVLLGLTPSVRYDAEKNDGRLVGCNDIKPVLRPLPDLTKEEWAEVNVEHYIDICTEEGIESVLSANAYCDWFFKRHIDVFGLIEKGLAIAK